MSSGGLIRRAALVTGIMLLSAVLAFTFTHFTGEPSAAQEAPTMGVQVGECEADCQVSPGTAFAVWVVADAPPAAGVGGFQSEVFLDGLRYRLRACEEEVIMEPLGVCGGPTIAAGGQIVHGAITGASGIPFPDSDSFVLVELSVTCDTEGTYEIVLTAFPSSAFGAIYTDLNGEAVEVATAGTRTLLVGAEDPDALEEREIEIADAVTVNCQEPAPPTDAPDGDDATATPVPPSDLPGTGSGGEAGTGVLALLWALAAVLVTGAAVAMVTGWRGLRRRVQ